MNFTNDETEIILKKFSNPNINGENILNQILDYEPIDDDYFTKTYFEKIYTKTGNIRKNLKKCSELLKSNRLCFVHSYAKNGKSTFLKNFAYQNKDIYRTFSFDFSLRNEDFSNKEGNKFAEKCKDFYTAFFDSFRDIGYDNMLICLEHIEKNQIRKDLESINSLGNTADFDSMFNNLFKTYRSDLIVILRNKLEREMKVDAFIDDAIKDASSAIDLFKLLVLTILKIKSSNNDNLPFLLIFDNIDDILTDYAEYLTTYPVASIYKFVEVISKKINHCNDFLPEVFNNETNIKMIVAYRTANYVAAIDIVSGLGTNASHRERTAVVNAPVIKLTTVKDSINIVKKNLEVYKTISNIRKDLLDCEEYKRISKLISLFENDLEASRGFNYIMRLWNGNRNQFYKCVRSFKMNEFQYDLIENLSLEPVKGIFIHYTIRYFYNSAIYANPSLKNALDYSFNMASTNLVNEKCNLLRLVFSLIINRLNDDISRKRNVESSIDLSEKGISLFEILDHISLIKKNDELIYLESDFIELFDNIFAAEYDEWGQFLTCSKKEEYKNGEGNICLRKKYDFSIEINEFFTNKNKSQVKKRLDTVRLFYNDNALFFENSIRRHFEYMAYTVYEELPDKYDGLLGYSINQKALPELVKVYKLPKIRHHNFIVGERDIGYMQEYSSISESVIEKVLEKVEKCLSVTTRFYFEAMTHDRFKPTNYCSLSSVALNGRFYFADLISKHIGYLEDIRFDIINELLPIEEIVIDSQKESLVALKSNTKAMKDINMVFVKAIVSYLNIFNTHYKTIRKVVYDRNDEMPDMLKRTHNAFNVMMKKAESIISNDFELTNTRIQNEKKNR